MNYLLDTHTFLWFLEGNENLSDDARFAIENPNYISFISIASIWEIAIKLNLGKLRLDIKLEELKSEILKNGFEILPLDFEHIIGLSNLEAIHKTHLIELLSPKLFVKNAPLFLEIQTLTFTKT